jgi:ABC-2 type transport system permease protein
MSRYVEATTRAARAEWVKVRSVRGSWWLTLAGILLTVGFGLLICSAVDTAGGSPGCVPGAAGCGDEDVVLNSLGGAYIGQIAFVALGIMAITSEYASGTIRTTFLAEPIRRRVLLAKTGVVAMVALLIGSAAAITSFLVGQRILHGNGFVPANGYPFVSWTDPPALRAIAGTTIYLALAAVLGLGVGAILRRSGAAIAVVLGTLYLPMIVSLLIREPIRNWVQVGSPMMAGLAVQSTVPRSDSVPLGPFAGLAVTAAWGAVTLVVAAWLVRRRDA